MTGNILIDPQRLRESGSHFHNESTSFDQVLSRLRGAVSGLDVIAWTPGEDLQVAPKLLQAEVDGRFRVGKRVQLGITLTCVAEAFEHTDRAAIAELMGLEASGVAKLAMLAVPPWVRDGFEWWAEAFEQEHGRPPTNAEYEEFLLSWKLSGEGQVQWTDEDWIAFYYARQAGLEDWLALGMIFPIPMSGTEVLAHVEALNRDPTPLLTSVHALSYDERQAILQQIQDEPDLLKILEPDFATAYTASLLEGALHWPGPSGPNVWNDYAIADTSDFAAWIRGGDESLNRPDLSDGTMNCWEYALYSAYLSGEIDYQHLVDLHDRAATAGAAAAVDGGTWAGYNAYYDVLREELGVDNAVSWQSGDDIPPAGSVIFFDDLSHVAVSLGTVDADGQVEIMSLWTLPTDARGSQVHSAQHTTIEDLLSAASAAGFDDMEVTYGENPW